MTSANLATREWMRKNNLYDKDIEELLSSDKFNVKYPESDFKGFTQKQWDELYRLATVERFKELKDQQSRNRLQDKVNKLEKEWRRISGLKKTVGSKKTGTKNKSSKSKEQSDNLLQQGRELKKYMQKNEVWEVELFNQLVLAGVTNEGQIATVDTQESYDEIIRKVRVARRGDLKDQQSKNRLDKKLTKFEKIWREKTGIKKVMGNKKKSNNKKKTKSKKETETNKKMSSGSELRKFLQNNQVWEKDLYDELLKKNIYCEKDIAKIDNQNDFDQLVKTVRVQRFTELKDQQSKNRLDKKLVKFEKIWREKNWY